MADEVKSSTPPGTPDATAKGTDSGAAETVIEVDGVKYTAKEIQRLQGRAKEMERGVTKKIETLTARERATLATDAELKKREAQLGEQEAALRADFDFYTTTPKEDWETYTPKVLKAGAPDRPDVNGQRLERIEQALSTLSKRDIDREAEKNVDAVFTYVESALGEFELVSERALLAVVSNHVRENGGKSPTQQEVNDMAREIHQDMARKGVVVQKDGKVRDAELEPAGVKVPTGSDKKPEVADLRRTAAFQNNAEAWLTNYRAKQRR